MATISGYLSKLKREPKMLTSDWTKRWFSLEGRTLKYYRNKSSLDASKSIDLLAIESIRPFDSGDHGLYSFVLKTKERNYFLRTDSEGDLKRWVRGLREQQDLWKEELRPSRRASFKAKHYKDMPLPSAQKSKRGDDDDVLEESLEDCLPESPKKQPRKTR
ncbi:GRB2-associated binding protein [Aphanomyces cochlioides]|nr:GRB2-associated binding protein [Aphanomyces cochlioides]